MLTLSVLVLSILDVVCAILDEKTVKSNFKVMGYGSASSTFSKSKVSAGKKRKNMKYM